MTARRILTSAAVLLATVTGAAAAQLDDEPARVVIGPMGGISFATLRGSGVVADADVRTGAIIGGFATFTISPYFAFEPQVIYVQKGANFDAGTGGAEVITGYALTYLEIPLLFKARYPIGEGRWPVTIGVIAGPAIGLNTGCNSSNSTGSTKCGTRPIPPGTNPFEPEPTGVDYSAVFGVGVDVWHFAFQARYDYSFSRTFSNYNPNNANAVDIHNQAWGITLGYKIAIN